MQQSTDLQNLLHSVHRKSYPAYKSLKGSYQFDNYILSIDHVQGDPFASPSHISVRISHKTAGFPREYYSDHVTRITLSDYLTRQFEKQVSHYTFRAKGSGKSGLISVSHCGQEILERTACEITEKGSLPVSSSVFRPTEERLMPLSWKKSSSTFSRSACRKLSFTEISITKNWNRLSFSPKTRPISEASLPNEISLLLSQMAPFFHEKAAFPLVQ